MRHPPAFGDDRSHVPDRVREHVVHHQVLVLGRLLHLPDGPVQAPRQGLAGLGVPAPQPFDQHFGRRGDDEDTHGAWRRVRAPDRPGPLHFDVQDHVPARRQHPVHLAFQRAVALAGVLRRLQELSPIPAALELLAREEVIRVAVPLARPRRARGGRDRIPDVLSPGEQGLRDRRLAAPRWCGQHDDEWRHSRFSSCSRNFSSSPFIAITAWVMAASFALEPMVLVSRSSSCARKPSCFPTAPLPRSASRHAARWVRNRTSSSLMSTRSARIAISTASRCSSTLADCASSATLRFSRSNSAASRAGARAATAAAPASRASSRASRSCARARPSRSRMVSTSRAASSTMDSTSAQVGVTPFPEMVSTSGWRATKARSGSPFSLSFFLSWRSAATTSRARSRSTDTALDACDTDTQRPDTDTCPRSRRCRSRSRSSPSMPANSYGSLNWGLKYRWLTVRISIRNRPPETSPSAAPKPVMLRGTRL